MKKTPNKLSRYTKPQLKEYIAGCYNQGMSAGEIASALGVSQSTISYHYPKGKHKKKMERSAAVPMAAKFCKKSYDKGFAAGKNSKRGFFTRLFGG